MEETYKNIVGGALALALAAIGFKIISGNSRKGVHLSNKSGFQIITASQADIDVVFDLFRRIIIGSRPLMGGEENHIKDLLQKSIASGDCALMVDRYNHKIGFVCGELADLTSREMLRMGCQINPQFEKYDGKKGFKGFGLGLTPEYRGRDLGLNLMEWMKSRARHYGASYIWLGANSDLNNKAMWSTRTDVVGEGKHVTFFAVNVDKDLFQGR